MENLLGLCTLKEDV